MHSPISSGYCLIQLTMKNTRIVLLFSLLSMIFVSCKDELEEALNDDYLEKISWEGYYNTDKTKLIYGAFNDILLNYNSTVDGSNYMLVLENSTLGQLSLEKISVRMKNLAPNTYDLANPDQVKILYFKDYTKTDQFIEINSGNMTILSSSDNDLIEGTFEGFGQNGSDTLFIKGEFHRRKRT